MKMSKRAGVLQKIKGLYRRGKKALNPVRKMKADLIRRGRAPVQAARATAAKAKTVAYKAVKSKKKHKALAKMNLGKYVSRAAGPLAVGAGAVGLGAGYALSKESSDMTARDYMMLGIVDRITDTFSEE